MITRSLGSRNLAVVLLVLSTSCVSTGSRYAGPNDRDVKPPVLFKGLGPSEHTIVSTAPDAQAWLDQGLSLCWGFNYAEAQKAFRQIIKTDPTCAIAHWGLAYAHGPVSFASKITDESARIANRAVKEALKHIDGANEVERVLIEAIAKRYKWPQPNDRTTLDHAYADAMRDAYRRFPDNVLIGTLCADAVMHLDRGWANWGTDEVRGPITVEAIAILEDVLENFPDYAGAHHLYIHAVEASDRPERALSSARKLETLMPDAGHLLHMPAHIYMRLGMYNKAIESNQRAIEADDRYIQLAPEVTDYYDFFPHNYHFLIWAEMFRGSYERAISSAREMVQKLSSGPMSEDAGYYNFVPVHVMMRFGRWKDILSEPAPDPEFRSTTALWHHARAIAFANIGKFKEARKEAESFEHAVNRIPKKDDILWVSRDDMLAVARGLMWGEILFKEGNTESALASLRRAIQVEDGLPYSEPPAWMQPVRHAYGVVLLDAGRPKEAEKVYREDLERFADNVWSLYGLADSLRRQGRTEEAIAVEARYRKAAKHADVAIKASCFCGAK